MLRFVLALCCLLHVIPSGAVANAAPLETVTLQLKWTHAFQFAGYYAARELGYYRDAGLDVRIEEAGPGIDALQRVLDGHAEYGVGTSSLLLARKGGHPVVVLAVIFQHSPLVLVMRQHSATQGIHDLTGMRAMIEPQSDELFAYLKLEGIDSAKIKHIPHSHRVTDLIDGKVDAMSAYVTFEPYYLDRAGLAYHTYTPRAAGIDFYGDNLFTSEAELRAHPARVKAFREASLRGWQYAMSHPEEIAELIYRRYSREHSREFYLYEARKMEPLLRADLIEVGYMNPGRWRHIADTYADLGLLPRAFPLKGFLYETDQRPDYTWLYAALALLGVVSLVTLYIVAINRRLARALAASRDAEQALRVSEERHRLMAQHDALTGLPNRALFSDRLETALAVARRDGQRLAVMFIDLDKFKPVNDTLGHSVGDLLLKEVATRMSDGVRASDTVARIGGDEFVVLLRDIEDAASAISVGEKIRHALALPFQIAEQRIAISASIGIAIYPDHGDNEIELAKNADAAMYLAKNSGHDTVTLFQWSNIPS